MMPIIYIYSSFIVFMYIIYIIYIIYEYILVYMNIY